MKIAILGYGKQGQSAYEHWHEGNDITICDGRVVEVPDGVTTRFGEDHLKADTMPRQVADIVKKQLSS